MLQLQHSSLSHLATELLRAKASFSSWFVSLQINHKLQQRLRFTAEVGKFWPPGGLIWALRPFSHPPPDAGRTGLNPALAAGGDKPQAQIQIAH